MLERHALCSVLLISAAVVTGCAAPTGAEQTGESATSALTATQVTDVANVYNVGVANGFLLSFESANDLANAKVSFYQQEHFWPGFGPYTPDYGRSITYDGKELGSIPFAFPTTYDAATARSTTIDGILKYRTPYAPYFSLGSLIAAAKMQAHYMVLNSPYNEPLAMNNQQAAFGNLDAAMSLVQSLCRPDASGRGLRPATTFDLSSQLGPYQSWRLHTFPLETPEQGAEFENWLDSLRVAWGSVIADSSKLESGVAGPGCF